MSLIRQIARLARPTALTLAFALAAGAAHAAAYIKFDGIDGECEVSGFDIQIFGNEPQAALLVPAIQKVREAASRIDLAQLACDGALLPRMVLEVPGNGRTPSLRYELRNVLVTSYSIRGGSGQDILIGGATSHGAEGRPSEQMSLNFEEVKVTNVDSGEIRTYACSSGRCVCTP